MIKRLIEDEREISAVYTGPQTMEWRVGHNGITRIVPYEENGEMALVSWLAIYKGDYLYARVRADGDTVVYYKSPKLPAKKG